jgi:hypothetical protein
LFSALYPFLRNVCSSVHAREKFSFVGFSNALELGCYLVQVYMLVYITPLWGVSLSKLLNQGEKCSRPGQKVLVVPAR